MDQMGVDGVYSYGPTNRYRWDEISPANEVIYHEIVSIKQLLGHNSMGTDDKLRGFLKSWGLTIYSDTS